MTETKHPVVAIVALVVALMVVVPVTVGGVLWNDARTKHAIDQSSTQQNRASTVTACQAYNLAAHGIEQLVGQLRAATASSRVITPTEKAQREAGYQVLLGDFPKLDCTANPIVLTPAD